MDSSGGATHVPSAFPVPRSGGPFCSLFIFLVLHVKQGCTAIDKYVYLVLYLVLCTVYNSANHFTKKDTSVQNPVLGDYLDSRMLFSSSLSINLYTRCLPGLIIKLLCNIIFISLKLQALIEIHFLLKLLLFSCFVYSNGSIIRYLRNIYALHMFVDNICCIL